MNKLNSFLLMLALIVSATACEDYIDKQPVDQIGDEIVIEDLESLDGAVLGMYSSLQSGNQYGELQIFMPGILSDEMVFTGTFPTKQDMSVNNVTAENTTMRGVWSSPYGTIFIANTVLERALNAGTEEEVAPFVAEAKFGRALAHFNLVKLWGAVPLALTSDVGVTSELPRTPAAEVYAQIIADLQEAMADLPLASERTDPERTTRATKGAAQALLARVALYSGDLNLAGQMADAVINSGEYTLDPTYSNLYNNDATSPEIIFELFASIQDGNSLGFFAQPVGAGGRYDYSPNPTLEAQYASGDERAELIVPNSADAGGILVTNKYTDATNGTDQPIVVRLAEMYLIRAEANNSVADLNTVASRSNGATYASYNQSNMLLERKLELAFEGHRWNDLIRTGQANAVMSAVKPASWDATDILLPIPQREIDQNPTLTASDQNPGY
ncbi:RagB/SusD family nutrient uptake outer membrane protein [Fulvivirga sp. RKSG066]|uniref:RagB/SusD family nutrient uptake outer membrane protein n=1 Tax=Fulvivirga aurantia TaxID=2529383 RepID=UPI0012BD2CF5|nr:RagB/SusD family nutrient uptake outer membrane protein [Fulvivirga aurantia]MTI21140.1 RagB/SusD family nutrient uptake outer membrane protein [Fulvivirga aurantia]